VKALALGVAVAFGGLASSGALAQQNTVKVGVLHPVSGALSYSGQQGRLGAVTAIEEINRTPIRINGGYFILKRDIFDYIGPGEELVRKPFQRLVRKHGLVAYQYDGFWMAMDTFKDRQQLEDRYARGGAPWEVWNKGVESRQDTNPCVV